MYAKHGKLVHADTSIIKDTHFWITSKVIDFGTY